MDKRSAKPAAVAEPAAEKPNPFAGLTEGRIVHYVLYDGPNVGRDRPAIVTRVSGAVPGGVSLTVFTDGDSDGGSYRQPAVLRRHVLYSESHEHGTWHWPERV